MGYSTGQLYPYENERMTGMCAEKSLQIFPAIWSVLVFASNAMVLVMSQKAKASEKSETRIILFIIMVASS